MNPIFELGNSCIKFSFFTILNKNKVKLVITFFNKIKLSLFFHNKYYISFESMSSKTPDKKKYINQIEVYETFKPKYTEYKKIDNLETDIKTIAWYLPQFHTFKENDEWWGKGFTEWTNVKKAKPLYDGHYQPRIPHSDLGYIDGKPMLLVYRPLLFPDIKATTDRWREYQLKKTNKDLFLVFTRSIAKPEEHSSLYGFDIYVDFNIHNAIFSKLVGTGCENSRSYKTLYEDTINSYGDIAFKELFLLWDNSPRKKKDYLIMENFNFDYYRKWLQYNIKYTRKNFETDKRFMFINAWNEWGEGTYLEPDEANGYTMLDILADELSIKKGQNT
ncbi:glycoside hydrolase family 99-like domain-containing protein [Brachyspira pulli]|uniref:glycoside hydrolase family 99-like domain-containing protein n=1 Tax=Brachyspira pulli TaxID=310721 RepID=UPI00300602C1